MQSRLLKNILSVSGVLILVKALGFFKQMVIAGIFGANAETDLINLSYGFIGDIQYLLVQVMLTAVCQRHPLRRNHRCSGDFSDHFYAFPLDLKIAGPKLFPGIE